MFDECIHNTYLDGSLLDVHHDSVFQLRRDNISYLANVYFESFGAVWLSPLSQCYQPCAIWTVRDICICMSSQHWCTFTPLIFMKYKIEQISNYIEQNTTNRSHSSITVRDVWYIFLFVKLHIFIFVLENFVLLSTDSYEQIFKNSLLNTYHIWFSLKPQNLEIKNSISCVLTFLWVQTYQPM